MASFIHERIPAGPEFHVFRASNVETLYSNGWVCLGAEPVELRLPDFGTRYFTVQVVDAYSNSINISARTFGSAAACYWLAPDDVTVVRVATTIIWLLLRIQVLDGDLDVVQELQDQVRLTGSETGDALGPVVERRPAARLVISHADPGAANWLPCPEGEFYLILRIYSPGQEVVAGSWLPAAVRRGAGAADGL